MFWSRFFQMCSTRCLPGLTRTFSQASRRFSAYTPKTKYWIFQIRNLDPGIFEIPLFSLTFRRRFPRPKLKKIQTLGKQIRILIVLLGCMLTKVFWSSRGKHLTGKIQKIPKNSIMSLNVSLQCFFTGKGFVPYRVSGHWKEGNRRIFRQFL